MVQTLFGVLFDDSSVLNAFDEDALTTLIGPETVDRAIIGATSRTNDKASTIEFTRIPSNGLKNLAVDRNVRESVVYRIHPQRESSRLIFQLGTASPELAVQAATLVAPYVAGIDVNAGCPKPFSTSGGMGAALLSTPELLCSILRALIAEVGEKNEIGISVKIRLLKTEEETRSLVKQLCKTGITGLTIHCRTRQMRKTERAIRDQLRMVGDVCREAGVACIMNGDVASREEAERLVQEYNVDGAMIATAAEQNPSVFRPSSEGGIAPWQEVVKGYMQEAVAIENRWGNTKFIVAQMVPGKQLGARGLSQARNYEDMCRRLELEEIVDQACELDGKLGISQRQTRSEQKAKKKQRHEESTADLPIETLRKKQKVDEVSNAAGLHGHSDFLTDLQSDIVAPTVKV